MIENRQSIAQSLGIGGKKIISKQVDKQEKSDFLKLLEKIQLLKEKVKQLEIERDILDQQTCFSIRP